MTFGAHPVKILGLHEMFLSRLVRIVTACAFSFIQGFMHHISFWYVQAMTFLADFTHGIFFYQVKIIGGMNSMA